MATPTRASAAGFLGFVVDDDHAQSMFTRAIEASSGPGLARWMHGVVDPYVRQRAAERFQSEGDPAVGGAWAPLRESTIEIRESLGYPGPHPINERTGELEQFITGERGRLHITANQALLNLPGKAPRGEMAEKVRTAQIGGGKSNTRPRPVLGLDTVDLSFVMGSLDLWMTGMMAGSGTTFGASGGFAGASI